MKVQYDLEGRPLEPKRSPCSCSKLVAAGILVAFVLGMTAGIVLYREYAEWKILEQYALLELIAEQNELTEQDIEWDVIPEKTSDEFQEPLFDKLIVNLDRNGLLIQINRIDSAEVSLDDTFKFLADVVLPNSLFKVEEVEEEENSIDEPNDEKQINWNKWRSFTRQYLAEKVEGNLAGNRLIVKIHQNDGTQFPVTTVSRESLKEFANIFMDITLNVVHGFGIDREEIWTDSSADGLSWEPERAVRVDLNNKLYYSFRPLKIGEIPRGALLSSEESLSFEGMDSEGKGKVFDLKSGSD